MDSAGGSCFPSIDTLVKVTSLSKPTVIKYLKKASEDGWIQTRVHGFSGQGWKRNEYVASVPEKVVKEINRVSEGGKTDTKGGKTDNGRRLNSLTKVVKQVNSISPKNSSNNSPKNSGQNDFAEALRDMQKRFPQQFEERH